MKILYAIQGTGNGHLSRAGDVIPCLEKYGTVDILVSGTQADVKLNYDIKYKLRGLSFIFGKKGGVDLIDTFKKGSLKNLWKEIKSLPVDEYDIVINDFEPVSAWACYIKNKPCIGLSHQAAVINKKAPKPNTKDITGITILKYYAPVTSQYGFHFEAYNENIFTPVIRKEVRTLLPANKDHYTVYLPAYDDDRVIKMLSQFKNVQWQVFSKHNKKAFAKKNISVQPIAGHAFVQSMAASKGVLCGAGFETPAEALYLQKKLLVIPMKNQYEQQCNAAALKQLNVPVIKSLKQKHADIIKTWLQHDGIVLVNYPDITQQVVDLVMKDVAIAGYKNNLQLQDDFSTGKKFRNYLAKKIFAV